MKENVEHLRIVNDSLLGHHTRIYHVSEDGVETDISGVVQSATVTWSVMELNTVVLNCIKAEYETVALEVKDEGSELDSE